MGRFASAALLALALAVGVRLSAADPAPAPAPGELTFKAHNAVYNAEGRFDSWRFTKVDVPNGDITKGHVEIEVDLASVHEKAEKLTAHLRTPDFFDVATFPKATIAIDNAKASGPKRYKATASLDLHGVKATCPVEFEVVSEKPLAIRGTATLDRTAFKVGAPFKDGESLSIHNEVQIGLDAKLP